MRKKVVCSLKNALFVQNFTPSKQKFIVATGGVNLLTKHINVDTIGVQLN